MNPLTATRNMLNTALSLRSLGSLTSLVTPLSMSGETFPLFDLKLRQLDSFKYNPDLHYHTSAILATALDTATLPWRLLNGPYASPQELSAGLNAHDKKLASLDLNMPMGFDLKSLSNLTTNQMTLTPLSPHGDNLDEAVWCQSISSRLKDRVSER